jgi:hypothetical protein
MDISLFSPDTVCAQKSCACITTLSSSLDEKILGLSPEYARILIPVIVTLSVFILGILINYTLKKFERKSFLKSHKVLLIIWSRLLSAPINQQVKSCKDFAKRLQESDEMQPERIQFNAVLTNKLLSMGLRDFIDTIILNHRGKKDENSERLYSIISQMEFLELAQKDLEAKYNVYHQDSLKYMDDWNEAYKRLHYFMTSLKLNVHTHPEHPLFPFYIALSDIFNGFVTNNPKGGNIETFKNQLFTPIFDKCQKYSQTNPQLQEVYVVSLILQDLQIVIKKWYANRDGTGQLFDEIANRLENAAKVINENIDKLEKMKFKWLYLIN